jgi:hypothetical protein
LGTASQFNLTAWRPNEHARSRNETRTVDCGDCETRVASWG